VRGRGEGDSVQPPRESHSPCPLPRKAGGEGGLADLSRGIGILSPAKPGEEKNLIAGEIFALREEFLLPSPAKPAARTQHRRWADNPESRRCRLRLGGTGNRVPNREADWIVCIGDLWGGHLDPDLELRVC
jgi:hypothetical protein